MPTSERKANMKKRVSFIALILTVVMLASTLAACEVESISIEIVQPQEESKTNSDTQKETESVYVSATTESLKEETEETEETETNAQTEIDAETETVPVDTEEKYNLDTTPLTLTAPENAFPDYKEYETTSVEKIIPPTYVPFDQRYEAENYDKDSCTISWSSTEKNDEYSGGAFIRVLSSAPKGWDFIYSVSYPVTVPADGYYNMTALTSAIGQMYTSDFFVHVNGEKQITAVTAAKQLEDINYSFDKGLFFVYDLGNVSLKAGENLITFVIDNADSEASQNRLSFFFDYFTLTAVKPDDLSIELVAKITPDADTGKLENSDVIAGAAAVNVFDQRLPLSLTFSHYFKEAGEITYTIKDYFRETVYEGKISGEQYDKVTLKRGIKNHPTGYFTFTCGDQSFNYVVTPSFATRTLEDSPFAMDYASTYHNSNVTNCYNVTAAARLAGVTWVRERAGWNSYEPTKGKYNFKTTETLFKTITSTGMKLLVDVCPAPTWATASAGYTGKDRVGGFQHNQLEFYRMCKAMVEYYDGVVDAWELWNESDHGFAVETAELFSAWYKAGALGVLDADPNMIVSFGGYCQPDSNMDYVHLSMLNDILKYSSIYNYHSHIAQPGTFGYVSFAKTAMARTAHATASLYNYQTLRPTWITEAGMRIDNMVEKGYLKQANYIVTSTVESFAIGTEKHFWFLLSPYMEAGGDFGSFSPSLEPYPTIAAEATMTKVLGKAEYLGQPTGLSKKASGFVFYTGSRIASVLWSTKEGDRYEIKTNAPIIVTDIMGNETLYEPANGKVEIRLGSTPLYVTYSTAPEYLPHDIADDKLPTLSFTEAERVILSPEFENYNINNKDTKVKGHLIENGTKINVRVTNLNSVEVKGTISATLMGFDVVGGDKEITIAPYSEEFVTLTLKKTGKEPVNSYITFVGTFNGGKTSNSAAHVYTAGAEDKGSITINGITDGQIMSSKEDLANISATLKDAEGKPFILLNDKVFEGYTYENGNFKIDISSLESGKYTMIVAVETDGGDYIFKHIFFTVENGKVTFTLA